MSLKCRPERVYEHWRRTKHCIQELRQGIRAKFQSSTAGTLLVFFLINLSYYTTVRKRLWKCARNSKTDDLFEEWLFRKYHIPHEFGFLNPFEKSVLLKNLWLQNAKKWFKGHSRQILKVILTWATFLNIYNYFIVSSEQWGESLIFMEKLFPNYLILHTLQTTYIFYFLLISPLPEYH